MIVNEETDAQRLMALLHAALAQADACGSTLVAAMLAECIDAADRDLKQPTGD